MQCQLEFDFNPKNLMKKYNSADIRKKILTRYKSRVKAFLILVKLTVRYDIDGIGFNRYDAELAETLWKSYITQKDFSPKEDAVLRRILPKYSNQLEKYLNNEIEG